MSTTPTNSGRNPLVETVDDGIDRLVHAFGDDESGTSLTGIQKELYEVLVASDALLETVDLDSVPESVDPERLLEAVDFERLAHAIRERDPDLAFDLSDLERIVDARTLLDSIDVLEFAKAKRTLGNELEDVFGADGLPGIDGDSQAGAEVTEFLSTLRREARDTAIRQEARAKAETAQAAVLEGHEAIKERYEANRRRFSDADDQRKGRNPTAVSLRSPGPLPDSVSTRLSTVRSRALHSKTDPLTRVYGRRWTEARSR